MSADVIVVGAGVVGAATAFYLAEFGAGDVLVVDRATVGSGMSSRSSGLVRMHYTYGPEVELAVRSDHMFDKWPDLVGRSPCVCRTGFVQLVLPADEPQLRANVAMQQALGVQAEVIDQVTLAQLAPGLRVDDLTFAAWEEHGGYGDGAVVAGDLLAAARERGVRYQPRTAVRSLRVEGDRVVGIEIDDRTDYADTVVVAAGVWSPALLGTAGLRVPIEYEFHQVAGLKHKTGCGAPVACIDSTTQTYFRPEGSGAMTLVGAFAGERIADPDRAPASAELEELATMVESAARRVPMFADAGIAWGVTGVYDMTPDTRPLLGTFPGLEGLVVATGFSGMGFKISPAVGEAIAEIATSELSDRPGSTRASQSSRRSRIPTTSANFTVDTLDGHSEIRAR